MNAKDGFADYVLDMLSPFGPVEKGRMFGGFNVSLHGLTFALVLNDVVYFKTDEVTRGAYEAAGLEPFSYDKGAKTVETSYRQAPDCLDDWDALGPWVRDAHAAALRAKTKKPGAKKPAAKSKPAAKKAAAKKPAPKRTRA